MFTVHTLPQARTSMKSGNAVLPHSAGSPRDSNKTGRVAVRTAHIDTTVGSCNSSLQISAGRCISFNPSHKLYSRAVGGVGSELLQFDSINRDRVLCSLRNPFFVRASMPCGAHTMYPPKSYPSNMVRYARWHMVSRVPFFFCGWAFASQTQADSTHVDKK